MEFRNQDGDVQLPSSSSSSPPFSLIYSPPPIRGSAFSKPVLHASSSLLSPKGGGARNGSANFGSSARVSSQDPAPISSLFPSSKSGEGGKAADEVAVRYKECLRNHAAAAGGHVLDGCGEFMPNGIDALKCAACGCHRSFHRRDSDADADADDVGSHHRGGAHLPLPLLLPPPPPPHYHHHRTAAYGAGGFPSSPLLPSRVVPVSSSGVMASGGTTTESSSEERVVGGAPTRKRFRTKFTAEQKEKMVAFAERIGWRLQRHEEALVEQFCSEAGIKRHVLKVWMHNNKHSIKKQQQQQQQQEQQLPPQEQLQLMAREQ
ncbi:zinc-finger homeodomain protein 5-like [Curcuma longa]|uniref:zinc-finger homeodomain protein 5-like n=1 Tax=Curcuma longa TaxID=136217 RepID=UPI003D9DF90B